MKLQSLRWTRADVGMPLLILVCFLAATHEFEIRAVHLPRVLNSEADVLSRWNVDSRTKEQFLQRIQHDQLVAVAMPINFFQLESPF